MMGWKGWIHVWKEGMRFEHRCEFPFSKARGLLALERGGSAKQRQPGLAGGG